jgi:hypothetical protein
MNMIRNQNYRQSLYLYVGLANKLYEIGNFDGGEFLKNYFKVLTI